MESCNNNIHAALEGVQDKKVRVYILNGRLIPNERDCLSHKLFVTRNLPTQKNFALLPNKVLQGVDSCSIS